MRVVKSGYSQPEIDFITEHREITYSSPIGYKAHEDCTDDKIRKFNELNYEILKMINALVFPDTAYQITSIENEKIINDLMIINYTQFRIFKDDNYAQVLFDKDSDL